MRLHLVRHGPSAVDRGKPAESWGLRDDAADCVYRLRGSGALPHEAVWFTSPETKAVETAALLFPTGADVLDGIREAERAAGWLPGDEFGAAVCRSFERPDRPAAEGWEPLSVTRGRVVRAVRTAIAQVAEPRTDVDIVLVGHGTAWTVLVADLTGAEPDLDAWSRMSMPDHCSLDLGGADDHVARVASGWGEWAHRQAALLASHAGIPTDPDVRDLPRHVGPHQDPAARLRRVP